MHNEAVITATGLTRHFGETVAVDDLNVEVRRGEVFGFLGHNGAGKTTTVRLLNGVLTPTSGGARVLGLDPQQEGPALRLRTGVLTETPALDERLTATEHLAAYAALYQVPEGQIQQRVRQLLQEFDLDDRADEPVGGYSRGMKQRLALARTLLHEPELIFLDEPTSGLDPVVTRHVHELIEALSSGDGRTVFLCTHNLAEAQKLCDRVAVMEQGQLVAVGAPRELARDLWKGVRLEIEVAPEQIEGARRALMAIEEVGEVSQDGDEELLTAWAPDRDLIPAMVQALVGAGIDLYRLTPREPTLEEVYFAIHGEEAAR